MGSAPGTFAGIGAFAQPTASADLASVDYEPMTRSWGSHRTAGTMRTITGNSTGGAWMLALSPLVTLALGALIWVLTGGGASPSALAVVGPLGFVGLMWLLIGAVLDYRRLGALGHEHRPSVAWIIAGPLFYLIVRAVHLYRTMRTGTAPTWTYIGLVVAVSVATGVLALLLPREAGMDQLRAVETTLTADFAAQGLEYSVLCPSEAPSAVGTSFVCTASDDLGPAALIRVTWVGLGEYTYAVE